VTRQLDRALGSHDVALESGRACPRPAHRTQHQI